MKKEHTAIIIAGLFLLSYVLEAVVNPLDLKLATPYHYLNPQYLTTYPFTTALIFIRAFGIFLTPILLMSFFEGYYTAKAGILMVLIALMQLYSLQDLATGAAVVPLEWALAISLGGIALVIPMVGYFLMGGVSWLHSSLGGSEDNKSDDNDDEDDSSEDASAKD